MGKAEREVWKLVDKVEQGELRLPEMQRRYIWRSTRVRDLLDSLYRGYPSGAILLWETDEVVAVRDFDVAQSASPYSTKLLLLDGQQRLTSLVSVIKGLPVQTRGKKPIEILFNLEHPDEPSVVTEVDDEVEDKTDGNGEEDNLNLLEDAADSTEDELQRRFDGMTFVVSTKKLAQLPHWVKVTDVFKANDNTSFLKKAGVTSLDDPRCEKYTKRLNALRAIKDYVYRVDILEKNLNYTEVTEIFVRVNSLGAKLRSSDLALAQITATWRDSLKIFQEFQDKCAKQKFSFDLSLYLKNLIAFATGQSRFHVVKSLGLEILQKKWAESCVGMEFALNFLRSNVKIESPALLSSPFLVVVLAYFGHFRNYSLSDDEAAQLKYWVLVTNAKGRYSRGSSETILDQDIALIRDGEGIPALLDRLRTQVGRLDIVPEELEGRNQRSALFKTMFLAFRGLGACDWKSKLGIALDHSGQQHYLQFHHIFPKAVLRGHYTGREIDDIANLCFMAGKTNREISDKEPSQYFSNIADQAKDKAFLTQCIPTEEEYLSIDKYKVFLQERRKRIAECLNLFMAEINIQNKENL
jgi:hypothetical protein